MITKRNVGFIIIWLLAAGFALAQMGISNNGIVFPDGSVQTTASGTEYRIIGITTDSTNGAVSAMDGTGASVFGINALNQMCVNEFGAGVRAAFSIEQLSPAIEPSAITDAAWVRPTGVRMVHDPDITTGNDWYPIDGFSGTPGSSSSGPLGSSEIDCARFSSSAGSRSSLYRQANGGIFSIGCNAVLTVACSARVQIPVYEPTQ